ncbi:MFS transporter [Tardibacter chloracetimidivorans]|uniref:MFS transporter n=2 Tax=Tardibacter chloracetimidivorans TaxID=1921510 RepID=A0A1L3ZV08_9SPHN|nr:MFS transporter [Tardibacter chloracetimidivorans]
MLAPLRVAVFRRTWSASLFSNFGLLVQGVGAAWAMTELTSAADMVALVQTASVLPLMLFAMFAGAIADTYDRRKVAMTGILIGLAGAVGLTLSASVGVLTPWLILAFTFTIGCSVALFGPAWQASVAEQVPPAHLGEAVALNSISYNVARSFGPAIGGFIVAAAGATAAFLVNAIFFLPMIVALLLWRRVQEPSRLPPEKLMRAIISGGRYVLHSPSIRPIIVRSIISSLAGSVLLALMPLIARDLLGGDARLFGLMLGCYGIGAVIGAFCVSPLRSRPGAEASVTGGVVLLGLASFVVAFSASPWLTGLALMAAGGAWMVSVTIFNIGVQTMSPRWVAGRVLAAFQTAVAGGLAVGSWIWGQAAETWGVSEAITVAAGATLLAAFVGRWLKLADFSPAEEAGLDLADPEVELDITGRSGPIVIEIEYRVPRDRARAFYGVMQDLQLSRQRNGAYGWALARDLSDPELWIERFHFPTWTDFLRHRNRPTSAERELQERIKAFHSGSGPIQIRRMLERPFGSVRWRDDVKDSRVPVVMPVAGGAAP